MYVNMIISIYFYYIYRERERGFLNKKILEFATEKFTIVKFFAHKKKMPFSLIGWIFLCVVWVFDFVKESP